MGQLVGTSMDATLTAGVSYQFGPAFLSGQATTVRSYSCHVGYQIVRA